jgi:hypothetical protein
MKEYLAYKAWWMQYVAPSNVPSLYYGNDAEAAFEQHVKDIGLYKLMETLADWSDNE